MNYWWGQGQPTSEGDCVGVELKGAETQTWISKNCDEHLNHFCEIGSNILEYFSSDPRYSKFCRPTAVLNPVYSHLAVSRYRDSQIKIDTITCICSISKLAN